MTDPMTTTRKRLEVVDVEYATCPICEQEHPKEEMVDIYTQPRVGFENMPSHESVWVCSRNGQETILDNLEASYDSKTSVCEYCADNVIGFTNYSGHPTHTTLPISEDRSIDLVPTIKHAMILCYGAAVGLFASSFFGLSLPTAVLIVCLVALFAVAAMAIAGPQRSYSPK